MAVVLTGLTPVAVGYRCALVHITPCRPGFVCRYTLVLAAGLTVCRYGHRRGVIVFFPGLTYGSGLD